MPRRRMTDEERAAVSRRMRKMWRKRRALNAAQPQNGAVSATAHDETLEFSVRVSPQRSIVLTLAEARIVRDALDSIDGFVKPEPL